MFFAYLFVLIMFNGIFQTLEVKGGLEIFRWPLFWNPSNIPHLALCILEIH